DLWVPVAGNLDDIVRIEGNGGSILGNWYNASSASAAIEVLGHVFATGATIPGSLYRVRGNSPPGSSVEILATNLGGTPRSLIYDGAAIWTANSSGSISMVTLNDPSPPAVSTVTTGFTSPLGILHDGANVRVTDGGAGTLVKLGPSGAILQTVSLGGASPEYPIFDGANIWVPNGESNSVS